MNWPCPTYIQFLYQLLQHIKESFHWWGTKKFTQSQQENKPGDGEIIIVKTYNKETLYEGQYSKFTTRSKQLSGNIPEHER